MNYDKHFSEHLRIAALRVLAGAPACKANSSLLHSALDALGLNATRDKVRTELAWLAEQQLVTIVTLDGSGLVVATLTERGHDVAEGRTTVPGVQRPTPKG